MMRRGLLLTLLLLAAFGGLVAWLYGGMSPATFIERLHEAISVTHFKVGMIKAPFMALVIGIIANMRIHLRSMSLFDTLVILVLIAGGLGVVARSLREVGGGDGARPDRPPPS